MGFKKRERWRRNNQKSVKPNDTVPRGGGGDEENGHEVGKRTTPGEPQV